MEYWHGTQQVVPAGVCVSLSGSESESVSESNGDEHGVWA